MVFFSVFRKLKVLIFKFSPSSFHLAVILVQNKEWTNECLSHNHSTSSDLTEPSGPQGTCRVMGIGMALSARRVAMAFCASASLRGALTHVQPR